jgi:hypothetical protein
MYCMISPCRYAIIASVNAKYILQYYQMAQTYIYIISIFIIHIYYISPHIFIYTYFIFSVYTYIQYLLYIVMAITSLYWYPNLNYVAYVYVAPKMAPLHPKWLPYVAPLITLCTAFCTAFCTAICTVFCTVYAPHPAPGLRLVRNSHI